MQVGLGQIHKRDATTQQRELHIHRGICAAHPCPRHIHELPAHTQGRARWFQWGIGVVLEPEPG